MKLTHLLAVAFITALTACNPSSSIEPYSGAVDAVAPDTRLAAVMVRADWCASCKILEPKILEIRNTQMLEGLAHIVIDYTERNTRDLLGQADAAGVGPAMRKEFSDEVITGMLYLVDIDDQKVIGDARQSATPEQIKSLIRRKLREA